jgi:hypothetical protein
MMTALRAKPVLLPTSQMCSFMRRAMQVAR